MIEFHPVVCQTFDHTNIWRKQLGSPINSLLSNPIMVKRTLKTPRGANIIYIIPTRTTMEIKYGAYVIFCTILPIFLLAQECIAKAKIIGMGNVIASW